MSLAQGSSIINCIYYMQNIEGGQPKTWQKIAAGLTVAVIVFFVFTSLFGSKSDKADGSSLKDSEFSTVVNDREIVVNSVSVKKVANKYDYWFEIKNNSTSTFQGKVYIALVDQSEKEIASDTFSPKGEIDPNMANSIKLSAHTSPSQGIVGFRYWIKDGENLVKNGSSTIASVLE